MPETPAADDGRTVLPDGSEIVTMTVGELVDWLAEHPPQYDPDDPYDLKRPAKLLPAATPVRDAPRRRRR